MLRDLSIFDPVDVARQDYMEFFIERVLDHRGNLKLNTDIEFLVKWLDYDEICDSWEPYPSFSCLLTREQLATIG